MPSSISSKWSKTAVLIKDGTIRPFIPETRRMTKESLREMLAKYKMVYIKPNIGTYGGGVMKVETRAGEKRPYRYQHGVRVREFAQYADMYSSIEKETRRRFYLVQKGIHMLRSSRRPFDLRVMVQKSPAKQWETTGLIGRVAHPAKIVTNYHNGGTPKPVEELLAPYLTSDRKQKCISHMRSMGTRVAARLQSKYPGICEIGIDVALDSRLKPWILEVNTRPDPYIFRNLKDKAVFRKIYRYAKAYGRIKK